MMPATAAVLAGSREGEALLCVELLLPVGDAEGFTADAARPSLSDHVPLLVAGPTAHMLLRVLDVLIVVRVADLRTAGIAAVSLALSQTGWADPLLQTLLVILPSAELAFRIGPAQLPFEPRRKEQQGLLILLRHPTAREEVVVTAKHLQPLPGGVTAATAVVRLPTAERLVECLLQFVREMTPTVPPRPRRHLAVLLVSKWVGEVPLDDILLHPLAPLHGVRLSSGQHNHKKEGRHGEALVLNRAQYGVVLLNLRRSEGDGADGAREALHLIAVRIHEVDLRRRLKKNVKRVDITEDHIAVMQVLQLFEDRDAELDRVHLCPLRKVLQNDGLRDKKAFLQLLARSLLHQIADELALCVVDHRHREADTVAVDLPREHKAQLLVFAARDLVPLIDLGNDAGLVRPIGDTLAAGADLCPEPQRAALPRTAYHHLVSRCWDRRDRDDRIRHIRDRRRRRKARFLFVKLGLGGGGGNITWHRRFSAALGAPDKDILQTAAAIKALHADRLDPAYCITVLTNGKCSGSKLVILRDQQHIIGETKTREYAQQDIISKFIIVWIANDRNKISLLQIDHCAACVLCLFLDSRRLLLCFRYVVGISKFLEFVIDTFGNDNALPRPLENRDDLLPELIRTAREQAAGINENLVLLHIGFKIANVSVLHRRCSSLLDLSPSIGDCCVWQRPRLGII